MGQNDARVKLVGRLAEAFARVERDMALLYGIGYWDFREWVVLDGLVHKGEYFFTNGPEETLIEAGVTVGTDSAVKICVREVDCVPNLLDLDGDAVVEECEPEPAVGSESTVREKEGEEEEEDGRALEVGETNKESDDVIHTQSRSQSVAPSASMVNTEEEEELAPTPITEVHDEAQDISQSITPPSPPSEIEENQTIQTQNTLRPDAPSYNPAPTQQDNHQYPQYPKPKAIGPPIPSLLSQHAPTLARTFKENENLSPSIELRTLLRNNSKSSPYVKIMNMEKGDLIRITKFISGHRFWGMNLRTGEVGHLTEHTFFPATEQWPKNAQIIERYRMELGEFEKKMGYGLTSGSQSTSSRDMNRGNGSYKDDESVAAGSSRGFEYSRRMVAEYGKSNTSGAAQRRRQREERERAAVEEKYEIDEEPVVW